MYQQAPVCFTYLPTVPTTMTYYILVPPPYIRCCVLYHIILRSIILFSSCIALLVDGACLVTTDHGLPRTRCVPRTINSNCCTYIHTRTGAWKYCCSTRLLSSSSYFEVHNSTGTFLPYLTVGKDQTPRKRSSIT